MTIWVMLLGNTWQRAVNKAVRAAAVINGACNTALMGRVVSVTVSSACSCTYLLSEWLSEVSRDVLSARSWLTDVSTDTTDHTLDVFIHCQPPITNEQLEKLPHSGFSAQN